MSRRSLPCLWTGSLVGLAVAGFAWIWNMTFPRAGFDALMYTTFALEFAGEPFSIATDRAWRVFVDNASSADISRVQWPWDGFDDPMRVRWEGIYRMRPVYPLSVAALYPVLGLSAAVGVAFVAVLGMTLVLGWGLPGLVGLPTTVAVIGLTYLNPFFARWLVYLQTDGLGLVFLTAALISGAHHLMRGSRGALAVMLIAAVSLAFTRQSGALLPIVFGGCALVAWHSARQVAYRAAAAATISTVPLIAFAVYTSLSGLPSFADMLQDIPTNHFSQPDVTNPIWELVVQNRRQVPTLVRSLVNDAPLLLFIVVAISAGMYGMLSQRGAWRLPLLILVVSTPILYLVHPSYSELERTMAPIWLTLHLGVGALVIAAVRRVVDETKARLLHKGSAIQP